MNIDTLKSIIFIEIVLISFMLNYKDAKKTCKNLDIGIIHFLFFHHLIAIFISIGWIILPLRFKYLYLYISVLLYIHWILNKNRCVFTDIYYHMCGKIDYYKTKDRPKFRDIFWYLGLQKPISRDIFYYLLLFLSFVYCFYYKIY